ncbi:hypothetical protein [Aquifex pyrophilus]
MAELIMMWGRISEKDFSPERVFFLVSEPYYHWVETTRERPKYDFRESGFRQFVDPSSQYIITDALLMFGLQYANNYEELIESLNPVRLMVRMEPGSFLGMSHHFLGAPFEIEKDEVLREFLNMARRKLEENGFKLDVVVNAFNKSLGEKALSNLRRITNLEFRFFEAF